MIYPSIDIEFLKRLEGFSLEAYVLDDNDGPIKSGITIGIGIDLGYISSNDLRFVSSELINKLLPYIGRTGISAVCFLKLFPLKLTKREATELSSSVIRSDYLDCVKHLALSNGFNLNDYPVEMRTVVYSVYHQYGNLRRATPNFYRQITNKLFDDALANLRNFGDAYPTRRNKEADLFEIGLLNWRIDNV